MSANTEHEVVKSFQPPDGNMKIWRYMDLPKLIAFLETGSLHFARADTLGDPYEGSWTKLNSLAQVQLIQRMLADAANIADAKVKYTPEDLRQQFARSTHWARETTYINCWHGGETESAAMWKLYGTSTGSIVIQSTYQKLEDAIPDGTSIDDVSTESVYMGMVQYKDYSSLEDWIPGGNVIYPFIHKRKEFEYEKEVRAIIWAPEVLNKERQEKGNYKPQGIKVPIDIETFVETIRVQPSAPIWVRRAIEHLLERYGWGMKVMSSQIDIEPMY